MRSAPAHSPSSSDRVAKAITDRIVVGRLVPGQKLIEADLSHDLEVGRGTVREAFKRLMAEGVITLSPHRGAYVRALTRNEALDLLQVLAVLIGLAASLAAAHISERDNRKKFAAAYEKLCADGPHSDRVLHSVDRNSFWDNVFAIAGNQELIRIYPVVPTQLLRMQVHPFLSEHDLQELFADYEGLYNTIIAGDEKKADRLSQAHLARRRAQVERLPAAAFAFNRSNG